MPALATQAICGGFINPLINPQEKGHLHNILSFVLLGLFALPSLIRPFNMFDINHDNNLQFRSTTNQQSTIGGQGMVGQSTMRWCIVLAVGTATRCHMEA